MALDALAALFRRTNPGVPLPRTCKAAHVRIVEACTASGDWNADAARQMHLDAIEGAFTRSTSGAPTPKFIWGQLCHFLANARIGRAARLQPPAPARPKKREPEDPPASHEWLAAHLRGVTASLV